MQVIQIEYKNIKPAALLVVTDENCDNCGSQNKKYCLPMWHTNVKICLPIEKLSGQVIIWNLFQKLTSHKNVSKRNKLKMYPKMMKFANRAKHYS